MDYTGELWIVLVDPHERDAVDGSWGLARLRLEAAQGPPDCILCDPRTQACLASLTGIEVIEPSVADRLPRRSPLLPCEDLNRLEDLMTLAAALRKDGIAAVRTFGLRAGVIGRVIAESMGLPLRPALVLEAWESLLDAEPSHDNVRRWQRSLERWIAVGAEEVEGLDEDSVEGLGRETLACNTRFRVFSAWPEGRIAGVGPPDRGAGSPVVAVLASSQHPEANQALLQSLAGLRREQIDLRIHWLARRGAYCGIRAAQDFRRLGLAGALHWEDEPWMRPPWRSGAAWDLLLIPDCQSLGQHAARLSPLAMASSACGTAVAVIGPDAMKTVIREALTARR